MRNYVSPIVKMILYNKQDVITSSGTYVYGTDNGVFWPGFTSGGNTDENE